MTLTTMIAATAGWGLAVLLWMVLLPGLAVSVPSLGQVHRFLHVGVLVAIISWLSFPVVAIVACVVAWTRWTNSTLGAGLMMLVPFANGALFLVLVAGTGLADAALRALRPGRPRSPESARRSTPPAE